MPDDILAEYNQIQEYLNHEEASTKQDIEVESKTKTISNKDEKQVQVAFGIMANLALQECGIVISPEVDTGRGTVDFNFRKV